MDQAAYFEQMRQKRKAEILLAARRILLDDGLHAFTMQQLARSLDISTVTLYKYFKNGLDVMYTLRQQALQSCRFPGVLLPSKGDALADFLEIFTLCYREFKRNRSDITLIVLIDTYLRSRGEPDGQTPLPYLSDCRERQLKLLQSAANAGQIPPPRATAGTLQFINDAYGALIRQLALLPDQDFLAREEELLWQLAQMKAMFSAYLTAGQPFS